MMSKVKGKCRSVADETQQHHQRKLSLIWGEKNKENFCPSLSYQQEQQGIEPGGGECINTGSRRYTIHNVKTNFTEYHLRKNHAKLYWKCEAVVTQC